LLLLGLLVAGTVGYRALAGMSFVDGLYMTVITLTTVGFQEVQPLTPVGRLFTIVLIVAGVGVVAWVARNAVEIALGEHLWQSVTRRRIERVVGQMSSHSIICGHGRMGRAIVAEFERVGSPFVVVETDEDTVGELLEQGIPFVQGDATRDEVLLEAGIQRAEAVITVVDRDADNVMITITAKGLNPDVTVVARAAGKEAARKLRLAGADEVLSPYAIGGQRLALSVLRPTVAEFLSQLVYDEQENTELEEITVSARSSWVGKTLSETDIRQRWQAIVIGIRTSAGEMLFVPPPGQTIRAGDTLIIVLPRQQLPSVKEVAMGC
jgi:voltage-gated potassium channel